MDPNKKCGMDSSEESSKNKGKAVVAKDQQKGLYDDLVEESVEVAFSTEQEEVAAEGALQEFLYEADALQNYNIFSKMFNVQFDLPIIIEHHRDYLNDQLEDFRRLTASRELEYQGVQYVHPADLVQERASETSRLNKKFAALPESTKLSIAKCPKCWHRCRLVQKEAGFVVFLFLYASLDDQQEEMDIEAEEEQPLNPSIDCDNEEDFDLQAEKEMAKDLSLSVIRSSTSNILTPAITQNPGSLPLPLLPTYPLNGGHNILLSDIKKSLQLREDEALAILAQRWNFNVGSDTESVKYRDFVVPDPVLGVLDVSFDQAKALQLCFEEVAKCKEPTEEEFRQARESLEAQKSETVPQNSPEPVHGDKEPIIEEPQPSRSMVGSIDIWRENILVADENLTVTAEKYEFLKQAGGSRHINLSKDAALKYYINQLGHPHLIIYHMKLSCTGYLLVFTLKTLSHYLGGHVVHPNAGKILLLE